LVDVIAPSWRTPAPLSCTTHYSILTTFDATVKPVEDEGEEEMTISDAEGKPLTPVGL
jgi:hypothetical protein